MDTQASGTTNAEVSFGEIEAGAGDAAHALRSRVAVALLLLGIALAATLAVLSLRETWERPSGPWIALPSTVAPGSSGNWVKAVVTSADRLRSDGGWVTMSVTTSSAASIRTLGAIRIRYRSPTWIELVTTEPPWTATAVGLVAVPLLFWWWRRTATAHGRALGLLTSCAVATGLAIALPELDEAHPSRDRWLLGSCGLFVLAFVVAPPARVRATEAPRPMG